MLSLKIPNNTGQTHKIPNNIGQTHKIQNNTGQTHKIQDIQEIQGRWVVSIHKRLHYNGPLWKQDN